MSGGKTGDGGKEGLDEVLDVLGKAGNLVSRDEILRKYQTKNGHDDVLGGAAPKFRFSLGRTSVDGQDAVDSVAGTITRTHAATAGSRLVVTIKGS